MPLPVFELKSAPAMVELDRRFFESTGLAYVAIDLSAFHDLPSVLGLVRAPKRIALEDKQPGSNEVDGFLP